MNQKIALSAIACPPGTLAGGPIRARYFDGMFLTQADLETDQRYFRLKRRLTNRALGEGVVWGLRLEWLAPKRSFALSPGYAIDCCGNDLVVECPVELSEQQLLPRSDAAFQGVEAKVTSRAGIGPNAAEVPAPASDARRRACVVLQYVECPEESRPVHRDACAGPTGYCEPSRVRESVRLLLVPPPARPPLTPPEQFLDELYKWRDSLDPQLRDLLFPPQGAPPPTPATGLAPVSVRATIPAASPASAVIQIPAAGSTSAPGSLHAQQTVSPERRSAVVTFELLPSAGWAFMAGRVTDQGRVVETATPPAAPSMYWALDIVLPQGNEQTTTEFDFIVDDVEVGQTFGGTARGRVRAHVKGAAKAQVTGSTVAVSVEPLTITTERAEVFEDVGGQACLRELVPWGWSMNPANGSKITRALVIASLYAFLSETVRGSSSPALRNLAQIVYILGWFLLFGVNPVAAVEEPHRRKLAELILALYKRWCDGFAYPGPRCSDDHHGVYLGCVELGRNGAIQSFEMWEHRRYVVTGPLLGHWAEQFGIAPIDVIAGRFASAICCLAGLPPLSLPGFQGAPTPEIGRTADRTFHVGTRASVDTFARARGSAVKWLAPSDLSLRVTEAFTTRSVLSREVEVLAAALPDGGSIAVAVPRAATLLKSPKIRTDVLYNLRHTSAYVREGGREVVADFVIELLRAAPPAALLANQDLPNVHELAVALAKDGATTADVVEDGSQAMLVRARVLDNVENREAAASLVEHAEKAMDGIVGAVAKALGPKLDRSAFGVAANQERLAKAMGKWLPGLPPADVLKAAERTAKATS